MFNVNKRLDKSASVSLASTGDKASFYFPHKAKILAVEVLVLGTDASACVVEFDKRPLAGSDTGRGSADIGSVAKNAADRQGKLLKKDLVSLDKTVDAGDEIVAEVTTATGGACSAVIAVEYLVVDESDANLSDVVLV